MTDCPGRGNPASPGPKMFVGSSALKNLSSRAQRSGVERSTHPRAGNRPMNGTQYPPCHLERSREIHAPPSREASIGSSAGTISVPTAGKREDPSTPLRCARDDRHFSAEEPPYPPYFFALHQSISRPFRPACKAPCWHKKRRARFRTQHYHNTTPPNNSQPKVWKIPPFLRFAKESAGRFIQHSILKNGKTRGNL